jgi:hypothetical protein
MQDFNKLAASKKIEDKIKAAQDPECPAEALDKIVMDGSVPWGTEMGITLANAIASNPGCPPEHLSSIYENPTDDRQRLLVVQNPSCPRELMNKAVAGDDTKLKQAVLKNPALSADVVLACVKTESIGSDLITAIAERKDLDVVTHEIVDLKVKLSELRTQHKEESGYAWLEESLLSITDWGRDVFEALDKDEDVHIRSAVAKNPSLPEDLLLVMMAECGTIDEKLSALSNPSCPKESLITTSRDTDNYSSSRLRKAVALNPNTPKEIVNKLLEDEYKWVREAAATNSSLAEAEIKTILAKADAEFPSWHTYQIKSSGYGMVEDVCGDVSIDDVVQAILDGADSWSDHIYSDFYSYDDNWHEYGPTTLVDTVLYPDSSEEYIDVKYDKDDDIDLIGDKNFSGNFIHRAQSWEGGSWIYNDFELENEFKPECLIASDSMDVPGIISGYVYEDPETDEYVDIEGELEQSDSSGTDIDFYVNTKNGLDFCDDFRDMRDEMTEQDLDPESEDDVRKYLEKKYK